MRQTNCEMHRTHWGVIVDPFVINRKITAARRKLIICSRTMGASVFERSRLETVRMIAARVECDRARWSVKVIQNPINIGESLVVARDTFAGAMQ